MRPKLSVLVLSGVSTVLGIGQLLNSSWALHYILPLFNDCENIKHPNIEIELLGEACEYFRYWIAACSIGIITGVFQIATFGLPWLGRSRTWCLAHILICVLSLTSFSIAVDWYGFQGWQIDKLLILTVGSMLDMLFALFAAIIMFFMDGLKKN